MNSTREQLSAYVASAAQKLPKNLGSPPRMLNRIKPIQSKNRTGPRKKKISKNSAVFLSPANASNVETARRSSTSIGSAARISGGKFRRSAFMRLALLAFTPPFGKTSPAGRSVRVEYDPAAIACLRNRNIVTVRVHRHA